MLTTPNGEFNVLFNLQPFQYRHYDHKFEWTRAEFEDWCNHICMRFPDYCVQFHGIGNPPEGSEMLGCVSQMGLFIRKDFIESLERAEDEIEAVTEESRDEPVFESADYKLIHSVKYPFFRDTRSLDEKILDECKYHVQRLQSEDDFFNFDDNRYEIPIETIAACCWQVSEDSAAIGRIIKENFETEQAFIILSPLEDPYDSYEDDYYNEEDQLPAPEGVIEPTFEDLNEM